MRAKLRFLCGGVRLYTHTHTRTHILLLLGKRDCTSAQSLEVTVRHRAGVGLTTPFSSIRSISK